MSNQEKLQSPKSKANLVAKLLSDRRIPKVVKRLSYSASCIELDDVNAEFWRGVVMGLDQVKRIGDPIAYLIQRGVWQVTSVIRDELNRKIVQVCTVCGRSNGQYSYDRRCTSCGNDVENVYRTLPEDTDSSVEYVDFMSKLYVDDIRRRLTPTQDIVFTCYMDAASMTPYPAAEVARTMGISRERVRQHMEKIRDVALTVLTAD